MNETATWQGTVFDCDNHMYETREALLTHLPSKYRAEIQFVEVNGRTRIALQGHITDYIPNPTFDRVAAPGSHKLFYSHTNEDGLTLREMTGQPILASPAFREPAPRLELMDQQGLYRTLMIPSLASLVESRLRGPDLVHAAITALNEWMFETWSFDYRSRIFATPVLALPLVDKAIAELERVLGRGARAILIRPAPCIGFHGSRSIALPEFDPFWARVEEAGVVVVVHATDSVLGDYVELWEPRGTQSAFSPTPFRQIALMHRDIQDTITSLICHGTLTRFPRLKIATIENGAEWVPGLVDALSRTYRQMPQEFAERPTEVFRRNIYVNPFWEEDLSPLLAVVDVDHVLFGSDFPHPEGLAEPLDYVERLSALDDDDASLIMGGNLHRLLDLQPT
jgi:predicted TIM-barrel fold metal-dependent hydrolase